MPKISIITTVYNDEKYLRKCLNALTAQSEKDLEIIIVDDASTDASPDIIKEYAKIDSRIIPVFQKKNLGVSAARNAGLHT